METNGRRERPRDRLSALPDVILYHILSFLPTKTSVSTSILAKRWRFLWAFVPNLDFHCTKENHRIIDRVLLLHKPRNLRSLTIKLDMQDDVFDQYKVEKWINTALDRKVQYLHLYVPCRTELPFRLFTCETLVDLTLYNCGEEIRTLKGVWLARLKRLYLKGVEFGDRSSLPTLLSGSPVLEYLKIQSDFKVHFGFSCRISSPTVKWLYLESIVGSLAPLKQGYRLEINTPALEYLSVDDYLSGPIECGNLPSLIRADISHENDEMEEDIEEDDSLGCLSLFKFVDNLSSVKSLRLDLSDYSTIVDSIFSAWTPSFDNLTKLELTADPCFLSKFLQGANNLEILELGEQIEEDEQIEEGWMSPDHHFGKQTKGWIEPQQVPICLLTCLTTIKIGNIVCTEDGLKIVKYLLRNAKVLKRMDITYPQSLDSEAKNDLVQKISLFERVSKACELNFTEARQLTFTEASSEDFSEWDWEGISV